MRESRFWIVCGLALGLLGTANATPAEAHQTNRHRAVTHHRVTTAAITGEEWRAIDRARRRVFRLRREAYYDGVVTKREARRIKKARRKLHRRIYRAKHNDQMHRDYRGTRYDGYDRYARRSYGRDW